MHATTKQQCCHQMKLNNSRMIRQQEIRETARMCATWTKAHLGLWYFFFFFFIVALHHIVWIKSHCASSLSLVNELAIPAWAPLGTNSESICAISFCCPCANTICDGRSPIRVDIYVRAFSSNNLLWHYHPYPTVRRAEASCKGVMPSSSNRELTFACAY